MPRNLDSSILDYLEGRKIKTAFLLAAEFQSGWVYLTTYSRDIVYSGNTYYMAYTLLYEGITENLTFSNNQSQISLSGIPETYKAIVFNQQYIGNTVLIHQVFLDFTTDELVGEPVLIFKGLLNGMKFQDDPSTKTTSLILPISNLFARFEDKRTMLTNPSTHKKLFPSDGIFDMVPKLVDKQLEFGKL